MNEREKGRERPEGLPMAGEIFTKVFSRLWKTDNRFVVNKGGTASSKSFSAAQKEVLMSCKRKMTILVIRKVGSTLKDSVIPSFKSRIEEMGMSEFFVENKTNRTLQNTMSGSIILFRGLDDREKLKSIEGIDRVLIEEATELSIEDFYEVNRRARGREGIQVSLNFNPIDERHWLKTHFFDQDVENSRIVESVYEDNQFLTAEDSKQIEALKRHDYNQYRIYARGEWGIAKVNNPWLYAFDRTKHVSDKPLELISDMPVHLSFDFNINPMTCIAMQCTRYYGQGSYIRVLKEFELKNTTVRAACKVIKAAFPHSILTVTGDASGWSRNPGFASGNDTLWAQVLEGLGLVQAQMLAPTVNASHKASRNLCNYVLQEHSCFQIDPSCIGLINDCLTARPIETDNQDKEDQLLKGAGNGPMGLNLFDCLRYSLWTHHERMLGRK